ncbi:MAG: biopolymer transporter ExbD [Cryobacterium sp.]|nr:biopolymer transporter ExbD [Oligoflexia bacterium]
MSRRGGGGSLDFDLNLAPIIDCFTVLITFMLASASFISVSIFDAGFTPAEAQGDPAPPPITVTLDLKKDGSIQVVTKGTLESKNTFANPDEAAEALRQLKEKYPGVESMTITADAEVEYDSIVKAMEKTRKYMPGMVLGGF